MGVKISGLDATLKQLGKVSDLSKPLNSAAKRARSDFKTIASTAIREKINLKKSYVDEGLETRVKWSNQRDQNIEITVYAQHRGALLRNFVRGQVGKKGAMIEITKGKPHRIQRAFKLRLKQGIETVVWRKSRDDRSRGFDDRLFAMHGPSPSQIMNTRSEDIRERGVESLAKTIDHNIKRHLNGK